MRLFRAIKTGRLAANMTSVTVFELWRGAMLSPEPEKSMSQVEALRSHLNVLPFDEGTAEMASAICVALERKGELDAMHDAYPSCHGIVHDGSCPQLPGEGDGLRLAPVDVPVCGKQLGQLQRRVPYNQDPF